MAEEEPPRSTSSRATRTARSTRSRTARSGSSSSRGESDGGPVSSEPRVVRRRPAAKATEEEIRVLEEFLPQQLSAAQIEEKVRAYLAEHPGLTHAGKLTGALKKEFGDSADGKLLNEMCRKVLE